ncbi:MAG: glucosylceramidase [Bacteroidales bacterium]|nr:glucosylceramidase [Bacteroidales bacterium]
MNIKDIRMISSLLLAAIMASPLQACDNDDDTTPSKPEQEIPSEPSESETPGTNDVKMIVTTSNRSKDLTESSISFSKKDNMSPSTIMLDPSSEYQTMDGFGVAITGSTCYNLMKMTEANRKTFLTKTFSDSEGYGFSYCRVAIGCSDFSLSEYTCCDKEGIENFGLTSEETKYVIPILKEIIAINPDLKIMGTPWTPPRWMKTNKAWTSGELKKECYNDYATYFVKWIQAFEAEGIKIYSVTPQNEPLNHGNSASCYMPWSQERDFVKSALGPAFKKAGIDTKIYAFDHNYNYDDVASQKGYPLNIYEDDDAADFLAGAAYHNYGGNKDELTVVHNAAPGMDLVFSETSIGTWNDGHNLNKRLNEDMEEVALGTVNRWCKGVIVWNLMLDADKGPNRPGGCQTCYGAVDINTDYATYTKNSHYYIIAHMSSVVKPDAVRIGTSGYTAKGLTYSAFKNTDGSYAMVVSNNSASMTLTIDDGTHHFSAEIPSNSAVSFSWK